MELERLCQELVALARQIAILQGNPVEADGLQPQKVLEERLSYQEGRWERQKRDGADRITLAIRLGKLLYYIAQIRTRDVERGQRLLDERIYGRLSPHDLSLDEVGLAGLTVMQSRAKGPKSKNPGLEKRMVQSTLTAWKREREGGTVRIDLTDVPVRTITILDAWRLAEQEQGTRRSFVRQLIIDVAEAYKQTGSRAQSIRSRLAALTDQEKQKLLQQFLEMLEQPDGGEHGTQN